MYPVASSVDSLKAFPFLSCDTPIIGLKSELPTYLQTWLLWWSQQIAELPNWPSAFCQVVLIQPLSAAAKHVFLLLTNSFGALLDYIESSLMLQYNRK